MLFLAFTSLIYALSWSPGVGLRGLGYVWVILALLPDLRGLTGVVVPAFVIATMRNVGLAQQPSTIPRHLRERPFVAKMVLADFVSDNTKFGWIPSGLGRDVPTRGTMLRDQGSYTARGGGRAVRRVAS